MGLPPLEMGRGLGGRNGTRMIGGENVRLIFFILELITGAILEFLFWLGIF